MQVDDVHDIGVVMPMYNLIKYSDNYSKSSGILWQYCRDEPTVNVSNSEIVDFNAVNATTSSFKIKEIITDKTSSNGRKSFVAMVPLKYLSNFWRTLEMSKCNCEINTCLNWFKECVIVATAVANQGTTFSIIDTKHYVSVVTLSTQDNAKLPKQLESGFKRTIS